MQIIQSIQNRIYEIREQRVMIDRDLAELYEVETRSFNQAVKRNSTRFPADFMFRLTKEEAEAIYQGNSLDDSRGSRSQIVILNARRGQNIKYLPFAFTEQGVAMLSSVLHSEDRNHLALVIVSRRSLRQRCVRGDTTTQDLNLTTLIPGPFVTA